MFGQGSFINSAATTPEELARKRAEIAAMMPRFGNARYVGEGLGQLFMGIGLGRQQKALDGQEREGRASAQERLNAVFGGGLTGRARPGDFTVLGPSGTFIEAPPPPKPTESFMGKPDTIFEGGNTFGLPAAPAPQPSQPLSFGSSAMTPQEMLIEGAKMRGLDPIDVATAISYETGGTFDPLIQGPTTQWGTHDGLIQFGDPQAVEHGAVFDQGVDRAWQSQLDPKNGAVWSYLESTGVQPGMGLDQIYSAINAGGINRFGASDANNGGAPGTVADKVAGMAPHRENAAKFLGGTWISDPNGAQPVNVNSPQMTAATLPTDALMALVMDPWQPPEVRAMAQTMLQEQQRMNDPAYTMGLRADELAIQKAEAELAQMGQPQTPEVVTERRALAAEAGLRQGTPEYQTFMATGELPQGVAKPLSAEERQFWGIPPEDTRPYVMGKDGVPEPIGGGGVTVNNNMPAGPEPLGTEGQILVPDPNAPGGVRVEIARGSKLDMERQTAADKETSASDAAIIASDVVTTAANRALEAARNRDFGSSGTSLIGNIPIIGGRTDSGEVLRQNKVLGSQATIETLTAMREASPTGGALGSVTEGELQILKDKSGALDPDSPNYERDLADYTLTLLRTIHGKEAGDAVFRETWRGDMPENLDAAPTPPQGLAIGTVEDGWEYIGGDPAQPESWRKVQ